MEPMSVPELGGFDLDRYLAVSGATKPEHFDWSSPQPPLDEEALFSLGYMMDIESHTIVYMGDLLATSVVREVAVTAFLSCWAYEEFFHSLLLRRVLGTQGVAVDDRRFARLRLRRRAADRLERPLSAILSRLTRHFPAVHMTWGAINELSTLTGYQALIERGGCGARGDGSGGTPTLLAAVLGRIIKDERRHFAFYFNQARLRLGSPAAQRLTSFLLRRFWAPVGSSVRGDPDMRRLLRYLFGGATGRARLARIDATIARLPGLEWFNLAQGYCS